MTREEALQAIKAEIKKRIMPALERAQQDIMVTTIITLQDEIQYIPEEPDTIADKLAEEYLQLHEKYVRALSEQDARGVIEYKKTLIECLKRTVFFASFTMADPYLKTLCQRSV